MRLSMKGMIAASALLWGGCILFLGLLNLAMPTYAMNFLQAISSVYPWFHASRTFGDVIIGTIDALIDGAVAGFLFAWLYNTFSGHAAQT